MSTVPTEDRAKLEEAIRIAREKAGATPSRWWDITPEFLAMVFDAAEAHLATLPKTKLIDVWRVEWSLGDYGLCASGGGKARARAAGQGTGSSGASQDPIGGAAVSAAGAADGGQEMTDRPILFSGPMVRALLDGHKTQTRRILKPQPSESCAGFQKVFSEPPYFEALDGSGQPLASAFPAAPGCVTPYPKIRFAKGDRLWVRETLRCNGWASDVATIMYRASEGDGYTAMTEQWPVADHKPLRVEMKWAPSLHMPRWASRLTLTVTDVRVERLTDITEIDAMAEGIIRYSGDDFDDAEFAAVEGGDIYSTAVAAYEALWNRINGALAWKANPWVVAVSFTVRKGNIDDQDRGAT